MKSFFNKFKRHETLVDTAATSNASEIGGTLLRNVPPDFDKQQSLEDNWRRFFEWSLELRQPAISIQEHGLEVVKHPIGFVAVYLTAHGKGLATPGVTGIIRANIIPPGVQLRDDVHCHGYDFVSGLVDGEVTNNRYDIDFSLAAPEGEGHIGYQTKPEFDGRMSVQRVTDATIVLPEPTPQELAIGDSYNMVAVKEFHGLTSDGGITMFGKYVTGFGSNFEDISLFVRGSHEPEPTDY